MSHRSTGHPCSLALTAILAASLGVGCVTRGSYDELQSERDALQEEKDRLAGELATLHDENADLSASLAQSEERFESMMHTRDQLVAELRDELEAGQIEIRNLVDGVSLNVSDELLFPSGGVTLTEKGQDVLGRVARQIQNDTSLVFVEGHTDNVAIGSGLKQRFPTNWELAGARAAIVVRVLSEGGVDPTRLRAVSRGPFDPVASNDTEEGRAKNRRTEIILRPLPVAAEGGSD